MLFTKKFNFLNFLFLLSFNFISSGLDDDVKNAFVNAGFVRSSKSGKIKK